MSLEVVLKKDGGRNACLNWAMEPEKGELSSFALSDILPDGDELTQS